MIRALFSLASVLLVAFTLTACSEDEGASTKGVAVAPDTAAASTGAVSPEPKVMAKVERWYEPEHVARGAVVYAQNCASCHGDNAHGSFTWRKQGADGLFPPPPLDGSAHAWHHPLRALVSQIKFGARGGRGNMPEFSEKLSDEQVADVIAWFQSQWPDETYAAWFKTEMRAR